MSEGSVYSFSSLQRDVAGMLALASEVNPALGSLEGIKALARRIHDPEKRLNTQEQVWMVLAARAQAEATTDLGISVNGVASSGSLVAAYNGQAIDEEPVTIVNGGDAPLEALVTVVASPSEPLPAGGNGFAFRAAITHWMAARSMWLRSSRMNALSWWSMRPSLTTSLLA